MKKITFLTSLLFGLFLSLSINAQTTIEFESATSGDGTPSMTSTELPGVTITFTAATGNIDVPNGAGIGGSSGKVVYTSTGDLSQSMTVSFSAAVDIVSLQHFDPFDAFSETLTFTPTGGSNSLVTSTHPATGGATATLNWTGVTSFTITGSTLAGHYAIDKLQLSIAAPIICSAPTAQATSAVFGTETSSTLNITSFTAPVGGADGYSIFINDTNSFTVPVDGDEPTGDLTWNDAGQQPVYFGTSASPNITVSDLDPGTTYYYQVYAYNDCSGTETYETTGLSSSDTTALGELTITGIYGLNKVYNGTTAANAYGFSTLTGVLPGDDVTIVSSPVFTFVTSNVGTGITITTTGYSITGIDAGKYTLTQPTLSANISPAPLTVIATSGISKVYGATDPALTYTFTGFVNGNTEGVLDTGVSISRVSGENAGMYTVIPSGAADSNYSISFVTTTFSITRAPLTVTATSGISKVYGAIDPALTYTFTGLVSGNEEGDLDTGVSISRVSGENVGMYTVTPSGAADSNYSISFVTTTFSITRAPLTVTATSGISKVYGAIDPALTYTITGFVSGNEEGDLDTGVSISRVSGENAGMYTVTPSGAADTNYSVSFVTTTFSITKAPLTVTATSGISKVYGAIDPALTYTITGFVSGNEEGDLDTGVSISRVSGENAGMYTVTPSGAADTNYSVSFVTTTFSITKAPLTVTATSGISKVYGAIDPALTYTITGYVNGNTEGVLDTGVSISRVSGENAGMYTVTPSGAADSNYSISFVTTTFSITKAPLTVTATSGISKVYGAIDPALTYTITGFVSGNEEGDLDTGVSISRVSGENAGMYTVTPSGAADSNYSVSFVTTTFSITKAPLTVTATSGISKVYGAIDPALTYTITGFVSGNEEGDLDTGVSISRVSGENAGMYTVTPSGAADSNYSISFVTTTFSILSLVDLAVSIDVLNDPLVAGGDALETFRVSVTNNGPSAATGVELSLTSELPIGVSFTKHVPSGGSYNDEVWAVDALAAGNSKTLTFTVQAGADAVSGTDVVPLEFEVSGVNESQSSTANDAASAAISIISIEDTASIEVAATIERQNGLFIGQVTVTNQNDEAIPAFRLYVKNLPEDVQVYNANGTELYGTPAVELPYLLYNYPLAKEASVTISVEFFRPSMDPDFTPDYDVELLAVPETVPAAGTSGVAVTLFKELSNGDILIEVASIPGHDYAIEYSANMNAWNRVPQTLNAPANRLQWIDNGPPKTLVHPSTVPQRFYRLVDLTAGTN